MNITKLDNVSQLEIKLNGGSVVYMLDGRFHRGNGLPAVITEHSEEYFYRGVKISKEIALGQLSAKEIFKIDNMEIRQRAMEILGYDKFLRIFKKIHEFTPPQFVGKFAPDEMYGLYEHSDRSLAEPIKILQMYDPSKKPFQRYFIRVRPEETDCRDAVSHSYKLKSWQEFIFCKNWV